MSSIWLRRLPISLHLYSSDKTLILFRFSVKFSLWYLLYDRHEHNGPTIALIECPNTQVMKLGIRALDDFPCVSIPSNARDCQYQVVNSELVHALQALILPITIHLVKCIFLHYNLALYRFLVGNKLWRKTEIFFLI